MDNQEIKQLEAQAVALDAEAAAIPGVETAPQAGGLAVQSQSEAESLDLVRFAVVLFAPLYPSIGKVYTDPTQRRLASVLSPVMEKYGWSVGVIFEKYGAEINLAVVAVPLTMETIKAMRHDTAEREAQEAKASDEEKQPNE